jgi:predicted ribosomally synthesized peptide with nif11-like leader
VAEALGFLRRVREDPELAASVEELDPEDGLEPVLAVAAAAGFDLAAEDLRRAHRVDWQLRRARYA